MAATALFLVEAGPAVGLGHLQRCLSLAEALQQQETNSVFFTSVDPDVQRRVLACGFGVLARDSDDAHANVEQAVRVAQEHPYQTVIVDSYRLGDEDLARLRRAELFVVAIDDLARESFPCQVVVNGGAHAQDLTYRSSTGDTRFLLGPRYALLRPEFQNIPSRILRKRVRHILVSLGGADPSGLTLPVLHALEELPEEFSVTVVIGPFFRNRERIQAAVRQCHRSVRVVAAPREMRDLMLEADLAISGGGQTLSELAATGTPAVAVEIAKNQAGSLAAMIERGVAVPGGKATDDDVIVQVREAVRRLLSDPEVRAAMSLAGRRLVDGRGAERVAHVLAGTR